MVTHSSACYYSCQVATGNAAFSAEGGAWAHDGPARPRSSLPKLINLLTDPKKERDVAAKNSWLLDPVMKILDEFEASLKKYPPISMGTPGP